MIDFARLRAPFPPERISWRVGSTNQDKSRGLALAYIDARDVQDRLDDVCGVDGWQCRYPHANGKTVCEIGINVSRGLRQTPAGTIADFDSWIWKADGAGDTDVEAEKGALSDAFKRAAVRWGIGRYLYDVDSPWVELEPAGRSYKIKASEMAKLRALLGGKAAPKEAPLAPQSNVAPKENNMRADQEAWAAESIKHIATLTGPEARDYCTQHKRTVNALPRDLFDKILAAVRARPEPKAA